MVGRRLHSYIRHHRGPTNEKSRKCFYHCIILTLQWQWVLISIYWPGQRCFKSMVPLNTSTTIQCTEVKSKWKIKGPYSAPRLALKGRRIKHCFQMLHVCPNCFGWIRWKLTQKKMYMFWSTPSTFLDKYITAMKPCSNFKRIHF